MPETPDALHGEILRPAAHPGAAADPPALPDGSPPVPLGRPPAAVRDWFAAAAAALIPDHDGTARYRPLRRRRLCRPCQGRQHAARLPRRGASLV
jgi:hypothetical protein